MTSLIVSVSIATAAVLSTLLLLALRLHTGVRRRALAMTRQWSSATPGTTTLVLVGLTAVGIGATAQINAGLIAEHASGRVSTAVADMTRTPELAALQSYANEIDAKGSTLPAADVAANLDALPDVTSMTSKLAARLQQQPNDVKGWKMLGWSYLNLKMPSEAVPAYETALKLDANDAETKSGLEAAKAALASAGVSAPTVAAKADVASVAMAAAQDASVEPTDGMIRGMVDKLAARLETNPRDENGWVQLMRSRITLGETDAARAAFSKALQTFSDDTAVTGRLTQSARALGVEAK